MSSRSLDASAGTQLTALEVLVMNHVANGFTRQQIAARMGRSVSTIDGSIERAQRRLRAKNSAHAVHLLHRMGVFPTPNRSTTERETP